MYNGMLFRCIINGITFRCTINGITFRCTINGITFRCTLYYRKIAFFTIKKLKQHVGETTRRFAVYFHHFID